MPETFEPDALIVGAGPAGLAAAIELRKLGVERVMVVDREPTPGGVPRHCRHIGFGMRDLRRIVSGPAYARRYASLALEHGIDIHTETAITGVEDGSVLRATSPSGLVDIRAKAVALATGCRERPRAARLTPGSRPAGVYTTGSLQRFVHEHDISIGKQAVVVGASHVAFSCILTLKHLGVDVAAMTTEWPRHQSFFAYKLITADRYRTPILTDTRVTRIIGKARVTAVEVMSLSDGRRQTIDCDTVVFTGNWIPENELAYLLGLEIDPISKSPSVDLKLQTSRQGIYAVGNLVHPAETADVAALSGRCAAYSISERLTGALIDGADRSKILALEGPIQWISPHRLGLGQLHAPLNRFTLRVREYLENSTLEVRQGDRILFRRRLRRMTPNLPVYLPDKWLKKVEYDMEPIVVSIR